MSFTGGKVHIDYSVGFFYLTCAASSLLAMACLALIRASSLRAAQSTLPNSKSKPCEHWPARCTHPGAGPWPLSWRKKKPHTAEKRKKKDDSSTTFVSLQTRYLARRSAIWSVICPRAFAVARISFLSFPAHSSPTLPASSRMTRRATSPGSPEDKDTPRDHTVDHHLKS